MKIVHKNRTLKKRSSRYKILKGGADHFLCNKRLGEGAYGVVLLCNKTDASDMYALKFMKESKSDPSHILSFGKEIKIHTSLNHENIVKALNVNLDVRVDIADEIKEVKSDLDMNYILALEYCDYDLVNFLKLGNLPIAMSTSLVPYTTLISENTYKFNLDVCYQLFSGLKYLHDEEIVCFDIKPANVLVKIMPDKRVVYKLSDFGFAHSVSYIKKDFTAGTPYYMPWHLLNSNYFRDIYAYYCTIYFIITTKIFNARGHTTIKELMANPYPIKQITIVDVDNYEEYAELNTIISEFSNLEHDLIKMKTPFRELHTLDTRFNVFYTKIDELFKSIYNNTFLVPPIT